MILDFLDRLSNCSNRRNYEYTDEDVKKMFTAIKEKVRLTEATFGNAIDRKTQNRFKF